MKSLLSIKKWSKVKKAKKPVMLSRTGFFKEGESYPIFIWDEPINENDPAFIRAEEEAIKSFYEHPWPEEVLKRLIKKED